MQQVLVHIDQRLGPCGAWGYAEGRLTHFYPDILDVAVSARARDAMAERPPTISVKDWFEYLTDHHANTLEEFETIEVDDSVNLTVIVAEFRKAWKADNRTR